MVRRIDPEFYASAAGLLAEAFYANPCHVYVCPNPETRLAQLEWLLGGNLRLHVEADPEASFCLGSDSVVDAIGFWTRQSAVEIGALAKIRVGLLTAPFRLGLIGFRRALEVDGEIGRHRDEALGGQSCWYLNNMVVRDKLRGTGVGTEMLRDQIDIVIKRDRDAVVALATQREENLVFYRRLGFEIVSERTIGQGAEPFQNWIMRYVPD